ncbi:hypothetical protein ACFZAV_18450 [Streptomyces sp. NPDC008343]|uniref:hypothetical protein n=1 Tax=Streptomyces sp. NPDC008343 TaxID=3364828 RepID=UPI0036E584DA
MTTPPTQVPAAAAASASASEDRYARYRFSLTSGTGASQTLVQWLPLATVWATNNTFPSTTRRSQPGTRGADAPDRRAPARPNRPARP